MRRLLLLPLLLLAAGCGGDDAPGNGTDRAFAEQMVPHHQGAIDMARMALQRGEAPFVKDLARDIIASQEAEIATLREEAAALPDVEPVKLGGHSMMGMDMAALEGAADFDRAFLEQMIPHHEGAIEMSRAELAEGEDPELRALAEDIIAAQQREIDAMRAQLS